MERTRNRNLWIGLGILAALLFVVLPIFGAWAMGPRGFGDGFEPRPYGFYGPGFGAFFGLGLLVRFAFWGLIAFFIFNLFRRRAWRHHDYYDDEPSYSEPTPQEILRRRYAAGEITREQYDEMRRVLEPTPATPSQGPAPAA